MSQTRTTPETAEQRWTSWTMDASGSIREGGEPGEAWAGGWVDEAGGIGRVTSLRDASDGSGATLLRGLSARYPGVRWFADRGVV